MSRVTLTFDNGPTVGITDHILDALAERGLHAVFFVVAEQLSAPGATDLAVRAKREGHLVGNHSMTHTTPLGEDPDPTAAHREITLAQQALGDLVEPERLFRPFGGGGNIDRRLLSEGAREILLDGGYTCVLWNCIPHDWDDPDGWVQTALTQIERQEHAVVVLHDLPTGAMVHLTSFLDRLEVAGHTVTLELPPSVLPIRSGQIAWALDDLVTPVAG